MPQNSRRITQLRSVLGHEGARGFGQRIVRRAYARLDAAQLEFPLLPEDVTSSSRVIWPVGERPSPGTPLIVAWVTTPPAAGSGGHTTTFRMVQALEAAGHECVLYLYDRHRSPASSHAATIRANWPQVKASVRDVADGIRSADAYIATSWETAHVLASRCQLPGRRLHFVQDFEAYFYAHGSEYALAADSYRFGFRNIALGRMVHNCLKDELHVDADVVPFGCDTSVYHLKNRAERSGVVFYSRPGVPRRGYYLGVQALSEFHNLHPNQPIHVYGSGLVDVGFPVVDHGRLTPLELNALYNTTIAGIGMSFTNISLVVEEMLAAGTIPVVNDSAHSRADMDNPHVVWAPPTPAGIADALSQVVQSRAIEDRAAAAASSVRQGWGPAQSGVVAIIEAEVYG